MKQFKLDKEISAPFQNIRNSSHKHGNHLNGPGKENPETCVSSKKRGHSGTDNEEIVPKKLRWNSDDKLCYYGKTNQLKEKSLAQKQECLLNLKKQTPSHIFDKLTLESETAKGNYNYWLSDQDIRRIANIEYNNLYDIHTFSDNYENSGKGLVVIGEQYLDSEIVSLKDICHNHDDDAISLRTFIINLRDSHWVTLVISHQNGQYYGYYVDSLYYKDRAGNERNKIPGNISSTIISRGVKVKDLKTYQQNDGHNCGLFSLENAKDINDVLKSKSSEDKMLQRLQVPRDNHYFIERREYFTCKLNGYQREMENSIENSIFTNDIQNNSREMEVSKQVDTDNSDTFPKSNSGLHHLYDELYGYDQYTFAKKRNYFSLIGILYQLQLLMLCFFRVFVVHKYNTFSLATEKVGISQFDDVVLYVKNKTICIQIKHIDSEKAYNNIGFVELFPRGKRRWRGMFSINKYFHSFVKSEVEDAKYLVLFTNIELNLTEKKKLKRARWDMGFFPLKFDSIDIEEEKYKILKDCLYTRDSTEKHGFYQFSQKNKTRKELLNLLDSPPSVVCDAEELEKMKMNFLDKLILAVNQPNREKLNIIIRHEIEKSYGLDEISTIYNELHERMLYYLASPEGIYITEKNAEKFFKYKKDSAKMEYSLEQANKFTQKYNKAAGLRNYTPHIMYKLELLMFCLYRIYQHKGDEFFLSVENGRVNITSNICFHNTGKTTYVWTRYGSEGYIDYSRLFLDKEKKRGDKMFSINRYFTYYIKQLNTEVDEVEYLVIYTNMGLNLTKEDKLMDVPIRFNRMNMKEHKVLRDYLCANVNTTEHGFYQFSRGKTTRKILDLLDPWPFEYDAERLKGIKRNFLEKLVLAINMPDREKLGNIIKHEIGENCRYISQNKVLHKYIALQEVALRWLDAYKVHHIARKGVKKLFKDVKSNKSSEKNIRILDEDKDQFVKTIVADRGLCHFREFREFLDTKEGMDMLNVLYENKVECSISGMLASTGIEVINVFKRLYYILFHKDGEKTYFLKSLIENGITLSNISSMLTRTGNKAPEALEELYTILNTKLDNGKTYLEVFVEKDIMGNIAGMLNGAEHKAPEALKELYAILNTKLEDRKTYLEFFIEKNMMGSISSILNGTGHKTPEVLKALCTILSKKLDDGKTYLEFFVEKNIIGNISSMLCKARGKAPEALEALHLVLSTKLVNGKTYLEFFVENDIIGNISSMLSGAGHKAPEALKELYTILNMKLDDEKTYLEFFVEKNMMGNLSSILHGARDKAPEALKALYSVLSTELNGGKTYLEFFAEKKIMGNISSILHGARDKAPEALKALYAVLSTELDGGKTYLEFFIEKKVMGNISSMLNGAGRKAPKTLKALHIILSTRLNDRKTYLEFFVEKNIMEDISSMLSGAGHKASKALKALYTILNTKLANGKTYLEFFIEKKITGNIFGILGKAGYRAPEALKELYAILNTKLDNGKTYLEFFIEKNVMKNISSMVSGAGHKAPKVLKALQIILNTKLDNGKTCLEFFIEKNIMRNISSMLSGAGNKAPEALKELHTMLNTKLENGKTYLQFFVEKNIVGNISNMLSKARGKAPEALKALHLILSTKLKDGKTYLEFFVEKNIMGNISSMLSGAGDKASEALKELHTILGTKLNDGKTYLDFFVEKNIMGNISSILGRAGNKAPEALKALYAVLCTKLNDEKTYLEFFVEKKVMRNISSMLSGAGYKAPEALQKLYAVLCTKLDNEITYLEFFVEKNIMGNISSMLSGTGNKAPEALKELCIVLNTKLDDKKTYLEFFIEKNIMGNMSSMLNRAGNKAPEALRELYALLFNDKYLEHFIKERFELSNLSGMLHGTRASAPSILKRVHDLCFDVQGNKTQYFSDLINANHKPIKLFCILRKAAVTTSTPLDEQNTSEVEDNDLTNASSKPSNLFSRTAQADRLQQSNSNFKGEN